LAKVKIITAIFVFLVLASLPLAAGDSLDKTWTLRTEEDWYAVRSKAEKSLSHDDYPRFLECLDWVEMHVRRGHKEPSHIAAANKTCAALLDGRTAREIIVLGSLLQLNEAVATELENRALECESSDPETKKLCRMRADEARGLQALRREIMDKYTAIK
jgi:hypothetical protein